MKLDLEDVIEITVTVDQARGLVDGQVPDPLSEAMDEAQAPVFEGNVKEALVLIRIRGAS